MQIVFMLCLYLLGLTVNQIVGIVGTCSTIIDSQSPYTHYVIVRRDLPIGLKVAQVVHAAGESSPRMPTGTIAVVLETEDEQGLKEVQKSLESSDIRHKSIIEGEGEYEGQLMAIGLEPTRDRSRIKKVTSSLPLLT